MSRLPALDDWHAWARRVVHRLDDAATDFDDGTAASRVAADRLITAILRLDEPQPDWERLEASMEREATAWLDVIAAATAAGIDLEGEIRTETETIRSAA